MKKDAETNGGAPATALRCRPDAGGACRERLLSAATGLFARRGYEATTVRQIVSAAEVTAPVLYYHFGSKEGLLLAVVQLVYGRLHDIADHAVCQGGTVRQSLCNFADGLSGFARDRAETGRLFGLIQLGAFATAPPALIAPYAAHFQEKVRSMVREGVERGEFRPGTTEAMTWAILGAVAGLSSSWTTEQEDLKDVLETILRGNEAEDRCDPSAGETLRGAQALG